MAYPYPHHFPISTSLARRLTANGPKLPGLGQQTTILIHRKSGDLHQVTLTADDDGFILSTLSPPTDYRFVFSATTHKWRSQ